MKVSVVHIGNSKGIMIPEEFFNHYKIADAVDLVVDGEKIILTPLNHRPRAGWSEAAQKMRSAGDDELLIPDVFEDEVEEEW